MDKDSILIHSVAVTAANVHDLTPASELLHGDEEVVYDDAGYQGIGKRPEMAGKTTELRVAMRPGKRRALLSEYARGKTAKSDLITQITPRAAARPPRMVHMHQLAHGAQWHSVPERSLAA